MANEYRKKTRCPACHRETLVRVVMTGDADMFRCTWWMCQWRSRTPQTNAERDR